MMLIDEMMKANNSNRNAAYKNYMKKINYKDLEKLIEGMLEENFEDRSTIKKVSDTMGTYKF